MWILRLKTFIKSLIFHIYSGSPKSTSAEIFHRYNICLSCEQFNNKKSVCEVCGCNLSTKSKFLNKLAWADQECPIGKWPKIQR